MPEISRLTGYSGWIDLDFVERERTPPQLMKLGIRLHLAGLSLSNTAAKLEKFSVERTRKAVHDWVQQADLQPDDDEAPKQIALDETVVRVNDEHYWLYAAVVSETNKILHSRLFPARTAAIIELFLRELRDKHPSPKPNSSSMAPHGSRPHSADTGFVSPFYPRKSECHRTRLLGG